MRRNRLVLLFAGTATLTTAALVASASATSSSPFQAFVEFGFGTPTLDNIVVDNGLELKNIDVQDRTSTWYRSPSTDEQWTLELQKDDFDQFDGQDRCVDIDSNSALFESTTLRSDGISFRIGPAHAEDGTVVSSIAPDTEIAIPQTASDIEGIHALLAGAQGGDSALMVDFIYADDTVSTVTVDILENELKGAIRNRRAEDGSWRITEFDELVETDTCGSGADQLWVQNPSPDLRLVSVRFRYADTGTVTLGGPSP